MRRLMLLRHAKAERSRPGERDLDRILTERGRVDAPRIGQYLLRHGLVPDLAVVSPSVRTRETYELVAGAFERRPAVSYDERLYEAAPPAILAVIRETAPSVRTLLIVGHNPGLQELAALLIATGDVEARQRLKENFPTSALAVITFAVDAWSRVHPHGGRLEHFVTPQWLAEATD
jgi:phosphohistidine phosphatase